MKNSTIKLLAVLLAAFIIAPASQASLIITFDTELETAVVTGSDTGSVGSSLGGFIRWTRFFGEMPGPDTGQPDHITSPTNATIDTSIGTPGYGHILARENFLQLEYREIGTFGPATITGSGVAFSYAHFSPAQKTYLPSLTGEAISLQTDGNMNGFSPVLISVIPEPSMLALALVGVVGIELRLRKK
jgi:hypothetical protein